MWGPHGAKWRHVTKATSSGRWGAGRRLGGRAPSVGGGAHHPEAEAVRSQLIEGFFGWLVLCLFAVPLVLLGVSLLDRWFDFLPSDPELAALGELMVLIGMSAAYWVWRLADLNVPRRGRGFAVALALALHLAMALPVLA